jgi:excisionase family DNA binding protein
MRERLLTIEQVAEVLGCSPRTVQRRITSGALPIFRDGQMVRVRERDLERYISARIERRGGAAPASPTGVVLPAGARFWDDPSTLATLDRQSSSTTTRRRR